MQWYRESVDMSVLADTLPLRRRPAEADFYQLGAELLVFQELLELLDRQRAQSLSVIIARDIGALLKLLCLCAVFRCFLLFFHVSPRLPTVRGNVADRVAQSDDGCHGGT